MRVQPLVPRPTRSDDYVIKRAVELAFDEVFAWQNKYGGWTQEEVKEKLTKLFKHNPYEEDGLKLANAYSAYDANFDLAAIFNSDFIVLAQKELEKQWVKAYNVCLPDNIKHNTKVKIISTHRKGDTGILDLEYRKATGYSYKDGSVIVHLDSWPEMNSVLHIEDLEFLDVE